MKALGFDIGNKLYKAGLLPERVKRIVIDINLNEIMTIYYETIASQEAIDLTIENLIQHKDKIKVVPVGVEHAKQT